MKNREQAAKRLVYRRGGTQADALRLFEILQTTDVQFALSVIDIAQFYEREVCWTAAMIKQTIRRNG